MSKWDMVRLADVLEIKNGRSHRNVENKHGLYPIYGSGGIMGYATQYICSADTVIIGRKGNINKPIFVDVPLWNVDTAFGLVANREMLYPKYLYYFCEMFNFEKLNTTVTIPSLTKSNLLNIEIPLPPLSVQKQIADVLDRAACLKELRSRQLEKMDLLIKSKFIDMFGDPVTNPMGWEKVNVATICEIIDGDRGPNYPKQTEFQESGYCLFLNTGNVTKFGFDFSKTQFITMKKDETLRKGKLKRHDVVLTTRGTVGNLAYYSEEIPYENIRINSGMVILRELREMHSIFFIECFRNEKAFKKMMTGSAQPQLPITNLKKTRVISPPFHLQLQFADFVACAEEQKAAMRRGLEGMEMNCRALMQEYFG